MKTSQIKVCQHFCSVLFVMLFVGCAPAGSTGAPPANDCIVGTEPGPDGRCAPKETIDHEDCAGNVDADNDGDLPSVDSDCTQSQLGDAGHGNVGEPDASVEPRDAGYIPRCERRFCFLLQNGQFRKLDDGGFTFNSGIPLVGQGINTVEVGLPTPHALKVCYEPTLDMDGDGIQNCTDNCWTAPNAPPGCADDEACQAAGAGYCVNDNNPQNPTSNHCSDQQDMDGDGFGDLCDPDKFKHDPAGLEITDDDPDNDGIPENQDCCGLATTIEENWCAPQNQSCQPP